MRFRDASHLTSNEDARAFVVEELADWITAMQSGQVRVRIPRLRGLMRLIPHYPFHFHAELFFHSSGRKRYLFPEEEIEVGAGEICLVPRHMPHAERVQPWAGKPFQGLLFCPLPKWIVFHIAKERGGRPKGHFITKIEVPLPRLALLLDEAVELSEHGGEFAEAGINALVLAHLVLLHKALTGWEPPPPREPLKVSQTRLLIERGLQNPEISVASLADELNCTPGHLSQIFRQSTGTPLLAYLNEQRHQRALHLLTHTALQIAEVSAACGFSDPNYFTRAFSRREGATPREWRKQATAALNIGHPTR